MTDQKKNMSMLEKLDEAIMRYTILKALAFGIIVFIILPAWFILGKLEQTYMWLRGYDWDKGYGGYRHRKTGERIRSGF